MVGGHAIRYRRCPAADGVRRDRRAGAVRRGPRLRRGVGIRPLRPDVRRGPGQLLRGDDDAGGAGVGHEHYPPRPARDRRHLPASFGLRRPGGDGGPRQCGSSRAGARSGLVRRRAPPARIGVPADGTPLRPVGGRARDPHAPVHRGRRVLPGRALQPRQGPDAPCARAATAPAHLDRGLGSAPNPAAGGEVGRRLAHLRQPRAAGHAVGASSTGWPRPRAATRRRSCERRRCRSPSPGTRSDAIRGRHARRRCRLPRVRVAGRGTRSGRGIRDEGDGRVRRPDVRRARRPRRGSTPFETGVAALEHGAHTFDGVGRARQDDLFRQLVAHGLARRVGQAMAQRRPGRRDRQRCTGCDQRRPSRVPRPPRHRRGPPAGRCRSARPRPPPRAVP